MKIHVFTVTEESYRYGDFNNSETKFFKTIELRDEYYYFVINDYLNNRDLIKLDGEGDYGNDYCDDGKWSYHIERDDKDIEIIEEKNW